MYDDQSIPSNVLMNHSDCNGSIDATVCGPLADALEELLPYLPDDPHVPLYINPTRRTEVFVRGLRVASKDGEPIYFR